MEQRTYMQELQLVSIASQKYRTVHYFIDF